MRITGSILALGLVLGLSACNTMKGAGEDIQSGGSAISDQATETQRSM
ncbi:entericidin A/B family lipoprotein [Amaricoccus solimangrovi]|uniref:Entericidin A/B family lipoprotein n=1 Tax=Amaricoccus solimangrovi TaxID=2589815 RepID=A0A501WRN4_9RHOB|nr:entericidin A/B family lipoprotein [Amaricoccus solimangrovi]TPE50744.1 entericidin A/B family lipoprotein [Amaricoccus solimangrovi]